VPVTSSASCFKMHSVSSTDKRSTFH